MTAPTGRPLTVGSDEAVGRLPARARVVASPGCATPLTLLDALGQAATATPGRTVLAGLLLGEAPWAAAVRAGHLRLRTWHPAGEGRRLVDEGHADYLPLRLGDVARHLPGAADALVVRLSAPDRDGTCSTGPSGSYTLAALAAVRAAGGVVVAELDPDLPRTRGATAVPLDAVDVVVDADRPAATYRPAARTEVHRRIAERVVALLPDEPTVQLGIGAVPEAVTEVLAGVRSLALVGMVGDGVVPLLGSGRLRRPVAAVEVLGGPALLAAVDDEPAVEVHPSSVVHDPAWIAAHDRFCSVGSALEVDLTGQVALEGAGGRSLSGLGGAVDFFEGARRSAGGLRVVALASTGGGRSKVVGRLDPATAVALPRHAVDLVVTEHGVADLRGATLAERAERLLAVADPAHRGELAGGG